ncbi:Ubiquinone/menaquinone biosynthesis C-methylase UbiE [Thermanaeromonas toyohensis ToBE]|uniref:Ubiquinone/menaquinone biosynthesis C-methylase UbiE n=1 Tax=Thermanaeromonas toyohensis ToBE TaxID=698762 RepID=A0A1W1VNL5_9FIRM|nr:class I SAM-dependent methyltransferase [Thermanaeromonas toyohensis]SMB94975.1 Ubiquinone/menaquinone biosynthesis C-methylase UbiE [Thermanaeromonas toyohensis ToBE]
MELAELLRLNELWGPVYPYLARHVQEVLPPEAKEILELGPFSGGITWALAEVLPYAFFTIGEERQEVRDWLKEEGRKRRLLNRLHLVNTPLKPLAFPDERFEGVIFRGAFFFLDVDVLKEIYRVLKRGGKGFVGGGFGKFTPPAVIKSIAEESRQLNYRLGKRWLAVEEVKNIVLAAGLSHSCQICTEGGLWVIVEK